MYHIRHPNGVTADWQKGSRSEAIRLGDKENLEVYEIYPNGKARRIRSVKR